MSEGSTIILITGASSGFGKLASSLLLAKGHTVIAAMRGGAERAATLFSEEEHATGRLHAAEIHMEKPEHFESLRALIDERFGGRLDVLVNNAGYGLLGPVEEQSEERIRHQMEVNFVGPVLLTNLLLPALRAAKGRILNVSSVVGYVSLPFYSMYAASKHALEGYSEGLACDLAPFGVQVGLIEPGGFDTGFSPTASESTSLVPAGSPYEGQAKSFTEFLTKKFSKVSGDPTKVAKKLVALCLSRRVPMRTKVGADAVAMAFLKWLLPDRLRLWLSRRVFGKLVS